MINIPLPFSVMWLIMLLGVMTHILAKVNSINHKSPDDVMWTTILQKFFKKEWASYGMSLIITGVTAYTFIYMRKFEHINAAEISQYAKWIPLAVPALFLFGVLNQWVFYFILGRIQSKGKVDVDILTENKL